MEDAVVEDLLKGELEFLSSLVSKLRPLLDPSEKIQILKKIARVESFLDLCGDLVSRLEDRHLHALCSLAAIQQTAGFALNPNEMLQKELLESLCQLEQFYAEVGGVIGYQVMVLRFLTSSHRRFSLDESNYLSPMGIDLSEESEHLEELIYHAIEQMPFLSEIYPIGGSADRLRLQDPEKGTQIPAAMLSFNGQTLLGRLVEDLQAREYLYFKIKKKQITLPIAMMISKEKNNDQQVLQLCEKNRWFYRPKEKFFCFCQPLVPVVDREGNWIFASPLKPLSKPGGHGVIWKLARDLGVFDWLKNQGASKAIVRQINNPVSSEDYHLVAFAGYGLKENKKFGFASCERQVRASEGINVIVEENKQTHFSYTLTNIEYCDFHTYGIQDEPSSLEGRYSKFPSNTNLLFVDLPSILEALKQCPIPGMLVNVKKLAIETERGIEEKEVARLESTMQNIADCFQRCSETKLPEEELLSLDTYITFNKRRKTISATKKEFVEGNSLLETPQGCFLDVMANWKELLGDRCGFSLPDIPLETFINPSFLFFYHPALGPFYSIIAKKLRKGSLRRGSLLKLQISDCDFEQVELDGALVVTANAIMGSLQDEVLKYSNQVGRCVFKNVTVSNLGVDQSQKNIFWKHQIAYQECCQIYLEGDSEFIAQNVTLQGDLKIYVEDGFRVTAQMEQGKVVFVKEPLKERWTWDYFFDEQKKLQVQKKVW